MTAPAFRELLAAGDIDGLRAAWASLFPSMPQPDTREAAEIVMHRARTEAESLALRARAYSHRWLCERGLPSGLPDELKPKAERIYPVVVSAVGISVNVTSEWLRPAAAIVQTAMADAVEDMYSDGQTDPAFVKARMLEVKERTFRSLFGRSYA